MTNLLHKDGMNLLVEETYLETEIEASAKSIKDDICESLKNINESDTPAIIEFRNRPYIASLDNVDNFVSDQLSKFSNVIFGRKTTLAEAMNNIYNINLVLGTDYKYTDLYNETKVVLDEDVVCIEYKNANVNLINDYKVKLEKRVTYCNECLFNDLYDTDTLMENLPVVYYVASK